MGERKVLNRYFPPDFDPLLVPRRKWDPFKQVEVRMMIPFSMQCMKCGEFMYRGKKFNSRKEDIQDDLYLGIRKFRFYIKCSVCSNEIAFKTDPEKGDYVCESGASRNFESWKQQESAEEEFTSERNEESEMNAMAALESKTLDSKIEMDILDALDEIKAFNEGHEKVASDEVLSERDRRDRKLTTGEMAALDGFKQAQLKARAVPVLPLDAGASSSDDAAFMRPPPPVPPFAAPEAATKKRSLAPAAPPLAKLKRRVLAKPPAAAAAAAPTGTAAPAKKAEPAAKPAAPLAGLMAYSASDTD
ncbi:hypothetical protein M885DRAFT_540646 [Pelagophyceae sp. CCMP2097]|nr:hypothetical protein M885DRAFT_540646 [Pelagophyceae sp. CCMP2097]|mmetsp:Transcript_1395/g.5141  ORF Transcript_1395/g.5141 Transcript_1395/m.5141 type:complete len:303 (+) Transcript_1395:126-1034(+)|eukprot:CAMPEP_0184209176 /NCGR_PEP_ID=MMETSP0976-20121227/11976_1 /TAXON_ID=483370 /ORGANISM="non described non described, Strain CCMP2097" /LENGTH=302 /DNA_ID=CAMNT_0026513835 /DNA_START=70 /DNA_END=978 /DNA_ORIENTATION=+